MLNKCVQDHYDFFHLFYTWHKTLYVILEKIKTCRFFDCDFLFFLYLFEVLNYDFGIKFQF